MRILTMVSGLALMAAPAFAGGLNEPIQTTEPSLAAAPYVAATDWTGGYAGGSLGYGWADVDGVDGDGLSGGIFGGYQQDMGQWVIGGEAGYDWADIGLDNNAGTIDQLGDVKLRLGYDLGDVLVYGTGGASYASADIGNDRFSDWGWLAGVGLDYRVSQAVTVGGEVLYHEFSDFDGTGQDVNATTLAARVAYHF